MDFFSLKMKILHYKRTRYQTIQEGTGGVYKFEYILKGHFCLGFSFIDLLPRSITDLELIKLDETPWGYSGLYPRNTGAESGGRSIRHLPTICRVSGGRAIRHIPPNVQSKGGGGNTPSPQCAEWVGRGQYAISNIGTKTTFLKQKIIIF